MKTREKHNRQRGVALFLAIFALLLLSGIGLAMLFSSDTETSISVNYRDKQRATYGALAGLQEARDRIHPLTGDLGKSGLNIAPTALPSTSSPNVLYVINPAPGETVAPWDPSPSNPYFDDELCHETYFVNNLGVTAGVAGLPCPHSSSSVPSGNSWYQVYNNSQHSTAWKVQDASSNPVPLTYKWVRVTLKADNMTPVLVGTGNGSQVCWSGLHELQVTGGYLTDCSPKKDGVLNIALLNRGAGYDLAHPPAVTLTGGGGSGASAHAVVQQLTAGVTSVQLSTPGWGGLGYTSSPNVTVNGDGTGAQVTAQVGSPVLSVSLSTTGTPPCYAPGAILQPWFNPTYGSGATGTVALTSSTSCIYSFTASGNCGGNTPSVSVSASNGSGSGFSGTIVFDQNIQGSNKVHLASVLNPGNYSTVPTTFSFSGAGGGGSCNISMTPAYGYQVNTSQGVSITNGGAYSSPPSVSIIGAPPAPGSGTITGTSTLAPNSTSVTNLTLVASGSGYTWATLTIAPPPAGIGNVTATGTASITPTNVVESIVVDNRGTGYTSPPIVTIGPPGAGGTQATGAATIGSSNLPYGAAYLLTALGQTRTGARAMAQMEVGVNYDHFSLNLGGALTLAGPSPTFGTPNSTTFKIMGLDCPTCTTAPATCDTSQTFDPRPSIGVYDDPNNPTNPTAVSTVLNSLSRPNNYIGVNSSPDVENAFGALGDPTVQDLNALVQSVSSIATNIYYSDPGSTLALGTATNPIVDVVNGNLTLGSGTGYGILLVTGNLVVNGDYHWNGLILVVGSGTFTMTGGGNGQINGAVWVANTTGSTLGSPSANWTGGGGNGLQYDHCWADGMLARIPYTPPISVKGLQVISLRTLPY